MKMKLLLTSLFMLMKIPVIAAQRSDLESDRRICLDRGCELISDNCKDWCGRCADPAQEIVIRAGRSGLYCVREADFGAIITPLLGRCVYGVCVPYFVPRSLGVEEIETDSKIAEFHSDIVQQEQISFH